MKKSKTFIENAIKNCKSSIRVKQIDIESEKVINEFSSLREAYKATGVSQGNISSVIKGTLKSAGGFLWEKSKDPVIKPYNRSSETLEQLSESLKNYYLENSGNNTCKVEQIDCDTNQVINVFNSKIEAAAHIGVHIQTMYKAINFKKKLKKKFLFREIN